MQQCVAKKKERRKLASTSWVSASTAGVVERAGSTWSSCVSLFSVMLIDKDKLEDELEDELDDELLDDARGTRGTSSFGTESTPSFFDVLAATAIWKRCSTWAGVGFKVS